jgi:cytochrome P450 family 150 subfamily A5
MIVANGPPGAVGQPPPVNLLGYMEKYFTPYIEERRNHPRDDVLTQMALAPFPDGSTPKVIDVVRAAAILFAGGQGTSARFQVGAVQLLAERPHLQDQLRHDPARIPDFVEEMLRWESPSKIDFRMARKSTTVAGTRIPAGSTLILLMNAADRDPHRFECPADFDIDRPNSRQHIAFGRGIHSCPGGPLVRAEAQITLERILHRFDHIRVSDTEHGPANARRWDYIPSYISRGIEALHLELTPSNHPAS